MMIEKSIARKVLLVGPDYRNHRGGIGAVLDIHKDQYEVFHFIPSYKPYANNLVKSFYFCGQLFRILWFLGTHPQIRIVHIHSSKQGSFYRKLLIGSIAKRVFGKKTINHIHTGNFRRFYEGSGWFGKKMIWFFLKLNDATITVSESWKNYFETDFRLKNVYKINNIVSSPGRFTKTNNAVINFLFLGLIHPDKGIFDLVEVLREHQTELRGKIKLYIGGNGRIEELQNKIKGIEDLVEFKGWVTGDEKKKLLQMADVFILPSYYEGVPVAILEAMSYGKPIIATPVGGIPEIVQPGKNGWLHKPGDRTALLNALRNYINEPQSITTHGGVSEAIIQDYYPGSIMPKLEGIYRSLL